MIGRNEYSGQDIKTPEGKRIYKAGVSKEGAYQLRASKAKTKTERDRLLAQGRKALSDALAKAIALNPPAGKKKV